MGMVSHFRFSILCASAVLLLAGCFHNDDETAQDDNAAADSTPQVIAMVGDPASPALATYLESQERTVVNIPLVEYKASAPQLDGDYIVWVDDRNGNSDIYAYQISTTTEFAITTASGTQKDPLIAGDYIVWSDFRNGNADIYGYQISTETEFVVTDAAGSQVDAALSGDYVVWSDNRNVGSGSDIYAYKISTGEEIPVTTAAGEQWFPKVSGDYIVWQHYQGGFSDVYVYEISSRSQYDVISVANSSQYQPQIDGDYIVWTDNRFGSDDIYAYKISAKPDPAFPITTAAGLQYAPKVMGDYIAWIDASSGNKDIGVYQISTTSTTSIPIVPDANDQSEFAISGDRIVWQDMRNINADIYVYDFITAQETRVTSNSATQTKPVVNGNTIVWLDTRRGPTDVYFSDDLGQTISLATNTWLTPAGVASNIADYDMIVFGSEFPNETAMLELFDAADAAGVNMLGLGGEGFSLAAALANGGRYGISVSSSNGCAPMEIKPTQIGDNSHPIFEDIPTVRAGGNPAVAALVILETSKAEAKDELAISTNTAASDSPADWIERAFYGEDMCNAGASAIVEFSTAKGTKVVLDGSANLTDKTKYWWQTRWYMLNNEVQYLLP